MHDEPGATEIEAACPRCGAPLYSDGSCPQCADDFRGEPALEEDYVDGGDAQSIDTEAGAWRNYGVCLFTDLVDSTGLKQRLGDIEGARLIGRHNEVFRSALRKHNGTERINPGDGFFATFATPSDAVDCALHFVSRLSTIASAEPLLAKVGIHVGGFEVLREEGGTGETLLGLAVDIAARVMSLALPRQILMTKTVFDDARQALGAAGNGDVELRWMAHGPYWLKGVDEPVEIYEAGRPNFAPLVAPEDSPKGRRVLSDETDEAPGWRPAAGLEVPARPGWILKRKLGEGGFGEVWVAEKKSGLLRTFKFCFRPDRSRALRREVTVFRWLRDQLGDRPDIVSLLDWHLDEEPHFLECSHTPGGNLIEWARERGGLSEIPLETRLNLAEQVAVALGAAHSVGVLHKDVKPSNILVRAGEGDTARVALTDFGVGEVLMKDRLAKRGITVMGLTVAVEKEGTSGSGTPAYMAPEVARGETATVLSDIYSLGVVLYQLYVGDFRKTPAEGWERDVDDEIVREDIRQCIDGAPSMRIASASELAARLGSAESRRRALKEQREAARKSREGKTLRRRALLSVLSLLCVLGFYHHEMDGEEDLRRSNLAIAGVITGVFERDLTVATQLVERAANSDELRASIEPLVDVDGSDPGQREELRSSRDRELLQRQLSSVLATALGVDWISSAALANARGTLLAHLAKNGDQVAPDPDVIGRTYGGREWFSGVRSHCAPFQGTASGQIVPALHISEPFFSTAAGNLPKLAVSIPIVRKGESGARALGVLQVAFTAEHIQRVIDETTRQRGVNIHDVAIANRTSQVVLHPALLASTNRDPKDCVPEWNDISTLADGTTTTVTDPLDHHAYEVNVAKLTTLDESFTILLRSPARRTWWRWLVVIFIAGVFVVPEIFLSRAGSRLEGTP